MYMTSKFIYLPKEEVKYLSTLNNEINENDRGVYQEQLDSIHEINLKNIDVMYLQYFSNLRTLVIDGFPDLENFYYISRYCNNISNLIIKNQPRLKSIDLTNFKNLMNLTIVSNENLLSVEGLNEELLGELNTFEFYDNNNYSEYKDLIALLKRTNKLKDVKIDALYYSDFVEQDDDKITSYIWHEKIGFIEQRDKNYSSGEMVVAYNYAKRIIDSIVKEKDSDNMKIATIYSWIINNIKMSDKRDAELNEGIVNVFRYREASMPTMAKFFQFLLRVAGIESFDINMLPRIRFISSSYGTFKMPSNDYEIIKIPTNEGERYFDLVWDYDITQKLDGQQSDLFMFNGFDDIVINHQLIFDNIRTKALSMDPEEKKDYINRANKRLQEVREERIASSSDYSDGFIDLELKERHNKFENYYKSVAEYKNSSKGRNKSLMDQAIEESNKILMNILSSLQNKSLARIKDADLSFIEERLGMKVSLFKNVVEDGILISNMKTVDDLKSELKRFTSVINREFTNKEISLAEYSYMKSRADEVYMTLITIANDEMYLENNNKDNLFKGMSA